MNSMFSYNEKNIFYSIQYLIVALSLLGIVCNVLTFLVFQRKRFQNLSFAFYFKSLIVCDSILLVINYRLFVNIIFHNVIDDLGNFSCRCFEYVSYLIGGLSFWLIDLNLLDRLLFIVYFQRLAILRNRRFQIGAVCALVALNALIYTPMPFFRQIVQLTSTQAEINGKNYSCQYMSSTDSDIVYWIDLTNVVLAELVVNNVLSVASIVFINKSRKRANCIDTNVSKNIKFAITMLVLNLVVFVLQTPVSIILLLINKKRLQFSYGQVQILYSIGILLFTINCASLLAINLLSNSIFRIEFVSMMRNLRWVPKSIIVSRNSHSNRN